MSTVSKSTHFSVKIKKLIGYVCVASLLVTVIKVASYKSNYFGHFSYPDTIRSVMDVIPFNGTMTQLETKLSKSIVTMPTTDYPSCAEKVVRLSGTPLPLTGLVSFPGSGNTWTRHLIQQMTGLGTSSVYCDQRLKANGFPYECVHKSWNHTIAVKTHNRKHHQIFSKIIFLIRNPYEALLSYANFKLAGHTNIPSQKRLIQAGPKQLEGPIKMYKNLVNTTTEDFHGPVFVLQYEKLKADMAGELKQLANFLDVNVTERDIDCTVKLQEGNFHRKFTDRDRIELLQSVYTRDQLLQIQATARFAEKKLRGAYDIVVDLGGSVEEQLLN